MNVKKRVVLLLCITALTLITIDVRAGDSGPLSGIRSTVREAFSPLQKGVAVITDPIGNFFDGFVNASELKNENKELRREVTRLKTQNKTQVAAVSENERLRRILELLGTLDAESTTARVVTASPSNFETTIQIDKGKSDGISVGDAVVDGDGLVGRIIEVSKTRSTILLITDSSSGVGVRNPRTGTVGIAQGQDGKSTLRMDFVDPDSKLKKGDTVVTSGLQGGRFPANIPVATVKSAKTNASGLTKDVVLTPIVDISKLSIVSVLHTGDGS